MDTRLEVVTIPVTDIDRAKQFYKQLGWREDGDFGGEGWRLVQFTPPGSPASIHFGTHLTMEQAGGPAGPMFLVVEDIEAARAELVGQGADVSEVFHRSPGTAAEPGVAPERQSYNSYASFADPDGNSWLLQEITQRLPGRV